MGRDARKRDPYPIRPIADPFAFASASRASIKAVLVGFVDRSDATSGRVTSQRKTSAASGSTTHRKTIRKSLVRRCLVDFRIEDCVRTWPRENSEGRVYQKLRLPRTISDRYDTGNRLCGALQRRQILTDQFPAATQGSCQGQPHPGKDPYRQFVRRRNRRSALIELRARGSAGLWLCQSVKGRAGAMGTVD